MDDFYLKYKIHTLPFSTTETFCLNDGATYLFNLSIRNLAEAEMKGKYFLERIQCGWTCFIGILEVSELDQISKIFFCGIPCSLALTISNSFFIGASGS